MMGAASEKASEVVSGCLHRWHMRYRGEGDVEGQCESGGERRAARQFTSSGWLRSLRQRLRLTGVVHFFLSQSGLHTHTCVSRKTYLVIYKRGEPGIVRIP